LRPNLDDDLFNGRLHYPVCYDYSTLAGSVYDRVYLDRKLIGAACAALTSAHSAMAAAAAQTAAEWAATMVAQMDAFDFYIGSLSSNDRAFVAAKAAAL